MNPRRPTQLTLETFDAPITVKRRDDAPHCPKCQSRLDTARLDTVRLETVWLGTLEIERCHTCHGLWFDVLEWDDARQMVGAERLEIGEARVGQMHDGDVGLHCPKCQSTPLTRLEVPHHAGLHIDKCPRCYGAFFDAGEFLEYRELTLAERLKRFWPIK